MSVPQNQPLPPSVRVRCVGCDVDMEVTRLDIVPAEIPRPLPDGTAYLAVCPKCGYEMVAFA